MPLELLAWMLTVALTAGLGLSGCAPKPQARPLTKREIEEEARFYGGNANFIARRTVTIRAGDTSASRQTFIAFSDGNMREELLLAPDAPACVMIQRPDLNTVFYYSPGQTNLLVEQVYRTPGLASSKPIVKSKKDVGSQTIDGHPCIECKGSVLQNGQLMDWNAWEATDLNRFPIHGVLTGTNQTMIIDFADVRLEKPNPSLFQPPAGYQRLGRQFLDTQHALAFLMSNVMKSRADSKGQ